MCTTKYYIMNSILLLWWIGMHLDTVATCKQRKMCHCFHKNIIITSNFVFYLLYGWRFELIDSSSYPCMVEYTMDRIVSVHKKMLLTTFYLYDIFIIKHATPSIGFDSIFSSRFTSLFCANFIV